MNGSNSGLSQYVPYLWIVIVLITIWAWYYVYRQKKKDLLIANRNRIEIIPSAISTLGVLGTFLGITIGLLHFDTKDLTASIPELLSGLKTAFFTSLAGMVGSLILSKIISNYYDEETGGMSDANQAAGQISKAVLDLKNAMNSQSTSQQQLIESIKLLMEGINNSIGSLDQNISNIKDSNLEVVKHVSELNTKTHDILSSKQELQSSLNKIGESVGSIAPSVGNIEEVAKKQLDTAVSQLQQSKELNTKVGEINDSAEAMVSTEGEISEKLSGVTDKLHGEVIEIEDKMEETNKLLGKKFDEFSELLKRNNTEALVEVMKRVTEEFQTQMNSLINKLVQENFDQLNKSVEKLNQWQVENKEMIKSLISQYKQMADNFEDTSNTLSKVKVDTQSLVGDGGKLSVLIESLNEVIIKDQKFKEISTDLQTTAALTKSNMESFDESTKKLNDWVKKQRDFTDGVAVLIKKLEELSEMKDYASNFWKETKKGMNDAVGIVKNGTEELNTQLSALDQQFYARLSTTLAQLDACIQALIRK